MLALLAQAAPTAEWHDGWQLAVVTFTALTIVAGWIHRQSKSDLKSVRDDLGDLRTDLKDEIVSAETRLKGEIARVEIDLKADIARVEGELATTRTELRADIAEVGGDLKDLKDKLYDDARSQAAIYQWQLAATQPAASEAPPQQSPPQPKQLAETSTD